MSARFSVVFVCAALIATACDKSDSQPVEGSGGGGADTSSAGSGGVGAGLSGEGCGGCAYREECESDPDECTPLSGCADCTYSGESWQISSSTCSGIPDGYYAWHERTGPEWCNCSGWPVCEAAGYKAAGPQGSWSWSKMGPPNSEFCSNPTDSCLGLPFWIVDVNHPTANSDCSYQCTSDGPSVPSATCLGPQDETCTLEYSWQEAP